MPRSDQGVSPDRYSLIPRCLIFLRRADEVLLFRGAPDKRLWPGRYNGVGGHIERGEDVLSAARRELVEETGLTCHDLRLCGTITVDTGEEVGIGVFVFTGDCPSGEPANSPEGMAEWVQRDRLDEYDLVEDLHFILPAVFRMTPEEPAFSAHYHYNDQDQLVITLADP